mmetsp:Transcript_40563/g.121248  ORF Transcript_40563/g.121248 Transcript_40563/m.121248 type:complete len:234 (-) Transcript_40563:259-960(-)
MPVEPGTCLPHVGQRLVEQQCCLVLSGPIHIEVVGVVDHLDALEVRGYEEEVGMFRLCNSAASGGNKPVIQELRPVHAEEALQGGLGQGPEVARRPLAEQGRRAILADPARPGGPRTRVPVYRRGRRLRRRGVDVELEATATRACARCAPKDLGVGPQRPRDRLHVPAQQRSLLRQCPKPFHAGNRGPNYLCGLQHGQSLLTASFVVQERQCMENHCQEAKHAVPNNLVEHRV